jgi:1-acyl-sn-glycerol-3-phosphate acyltransferase
MGRPLRIVGTGFCFLVFGVLGLSVLCVFFPLSNLVRGTGRDSQIWVRGIIHRAMRWFSSFMAACGVIHCEVRNREKLERRGLLVVANHPSLIDVVFLMGLLDQPVCVVKASLKTNLFTRGPVKSAGFIVNSDGSQLIDDCIATVRAGNNLIIFPEGTRSLTHDGALSPMKRGAANIALRGGIDLTPVVITVSEPMLGKGSSWYRVPVRRPRFVLTAMDDIPVADYLGRVVEPGEEAGAFNRMARALTRDLNDFFIREIGREASGEPSRNACGRHGT